MNEGARRGLIVALLISAGAVLMEVIYCTLAFTGFAALFSGRVMKAVMELTSFVFMLYLGIRFLTARQVESVNKVEARIEQRLHPHSAFMIGFVRTMGNPGVILFWIILAANFISHDCATHPGIENSLRSWSWNRNERVVFGAVLGDLADT